MPLRYYDNNVGGTVALLDAMVRHEVHDLVFSSSATVYGQPERLPITEAPNGVLEVVADGLTDQRDVAGP